ncbi:hypothetical protein [Allorhizobium ampelinum]|uniref:hypothetical protein n=1 Tax=Allorhizobium ampelinum TaxID=3025782 RepID=UPI0011773AE9|nr:hypothetical protein [Allorhizobium ampelinum]NTA27374.1 hypothetical protein [Allorhizobium ampelinum]
MTKLEEIAEGQAKFDGRTLIGMPRGERDRYMERARLMLECIREPTGGMLKAALDACHIAPDNLDSRLADYYCATKEYQAMIDKILEGV